MSYTVIPAPRHNMTVTCSQTANNASACRTPAAKIVEDTSRTNLNIRGLTDAVNEEVLRSVFSAFGTITSSLVMRNIGTGASLGTAFVRYTHNASATAAISFFGQWVRLVHYTRQQAHFQAPNEYTSDAEVAATVMDSLHFPADPALMAVLATLRANTAFRAADFINVSLQWARKQHDTTPDAGLRHKIRKLFVRNVPNDITADSLTIFFSRFGKVESSSIHRDTAAAAVTLNVIASRERERRALAVARSFSDDDEPSTLSQADDESVFANLGFASLCRRIAFVIFTEDGVAERAAHEVHNTKPFRSCGDIPLMVKLAENYGLTKHADNQSPAAVKAAHQRNNNNNISKNGTVPAFSSMDHTMDLLLAKPLGNFSCFVNTGSMKRAEGNSPSGSASCVPSDSLSGGDVLTASANSNSLSRPLTYHFRSSIRTPQAVNVTRPYAIRPVLFEQLAASRSTAADSSTDAADVAKKTGRFRFNPYSLTETRVYV